MTHPDFDTGAELAMKHRDVFVGRTFSKAFGMAGLRVGYASARRTPSPGSPRCSSHFGTSILSIAAAMGSLEDPDYIKREVKRNEAARKFTLDSSRATASTRCRARRTSCSWTSAVRRRASARPAPSAGSWLGRDFPPYQDSHVRISIGTLEEMQRATAVFAEVLGLATADNQQ